MRQAFIIMQIGNPELDAGCGKVIVKALEACSYEPKRVDKHNEGGLLKSEIISFIERADIIVADLTNERPNCYLEVGYAMGLDKYRNLILTAREDHNPDSSKYKKGGPKLHFDLAGYDVLFWNADDLDVFRAELEKRIRRRQAILAPSVSAGSLPPPVDPEWVVKQREHALAGLAAQGKRSFMEVRLALEPPKPDFSQNVLFDAGRDSTISTFGWPIGVFLWKNDSLRPRPRNDGIVAEVALPDKSSYDFWVLRRNGDFFLLKSLFEDERDPQKNVIFFDTRMVRVTETLLYASRLYSRLGIGRDGVITIGIRHGGLKGRNLTAGGRRLLPPNLISIEDEVDTEIVKPLSKVETELVPCVKALVDPLFVVFDLFHPADDVYDEIVNSFVAGRIA